VRPRAGSAVRLLGSPEVLMWKAEGSGMTIEVPPALAASPPSAYAAAFRIEAE